MVSYADIVGPAWEGSNTPFLVGVVVTCAGGEVGVEIGAGGLPINRCGFIRVDEDVEEGQGSVK